MSSPTVFLSVATLDLKAWRDHLHEAFSRAGFRVLTQDHSLGSASGDVRRLLTDTIDEADCVIHLAGLAYGSHATQPFPDAPAFQCSWTQFEYYHAHQQGKDVIAFVCAPNLSAPFTEESPDTAQKTALQEAHRDRVASGLFTGTPLEGKVGRTSNEPVSNPGRLLSAVSAAVGTLHRVNREDSERAQESLRDMGAKLAALEQRSGRLQRVLVGVAALCVLLGVGLWKLNQKAEVSDKTTKQVLASQGDLATQLSQVQEALSKIQQNNDPKQDPISQWPQERLETELARQMQITVENLRAILTAGKTSLDTLLQGQALLASGQAKEADAKFDSVIQQEKAAAQRLRQAYEGKAQIAYDAVKYEEALSWRQKAAALVDKAVDPEGWAKAQHELAATLNKLGRYREAEPVFLEVLHLCDQHFQPNDPRLEVVLINLADLYRLTIRNAAAEPLLQRVLKINEQSFGLEDPRVASALNNLASLYQSMDRLMDAEPLLQRALKIDEKQPAVWQVGLNSVPDPENQDVARDLRNLASLYQSMDRLMDAELLLLRALKIHEKKLGPEHPEIARDLIGLAKLYQSINRSAEAEPFLQRALKINEQISGPEHPNVVKYLKDLADLYQAMNRPMDAEPLLQRALKIDEASFGPESPKVVLCLSKLADVYQATNRLAEAERLSQRVVTIFEAIYGKEHPLVGAALRDLAQFYEDANRLAEAEPLRQRSLKIFEQSFSPEDTKIVIAIVKLAQLYSNTNRLAEAEPLYERALKIAEKKLGPKDSLVPTVLNNLAMLYKATNRLTEAESSCLRAVRIQLQLEKKLGHSDPGTKDTLFNYLDILRDLKLPEAEQKAKLESVAKEADLSVAETQALVASRFGPFDVTVAKVVPEGQGAKLGVQVGDIIRRYNDIEIVKVIQIVELVGASQGDAIPMEIQRGAEILKLTAKAGKMGLLMDNRPRTAKK